MPTLRYDEQDIIPNAFRDLYGAVSLRISDSDQMFKGDSSHYLMCGASALNAITAAVTLASIRPRYILDFGSGAGRVTRWLRAAYPNAYISATDIREADLSFCAKEFAALTWISSTDIDEIRALSTYDLIWAGSVLTHLSETQSKRLLNKMLSWLNPNGIVVVSLHGRLAHAKGASVDHYDVGDRWPSIEQGYRGPSSYGYTDYRGQTGYGISLSKPSWSARLVEDMPGMRLVMFSELAWDRHHDILAIQNTNIVG